MPSRQGREEEEDIEASQTLLDKSKHDIAAEKAACWSVLGRIAEMAGPMAAQNVFGYSLALVSSVAVGQLNDPLILSSVFLAGSVYNVTGQSVIIGLSAGLDTIAGQAFGAGNYLFMGEVLQRSVVVCSFVCLPILALWWHAAPLLTVMHQAPAIAAGAARYLHIVGPSLFMVVLSNNVSRYLTSQRVVTPGTLCTIITGVLCPLYNWLLIYKWELGLDGAAYAFLASNTTNALLLLVALVWREVCLHGTPMQTWPGFTHKAFLRWGSYLEFGLPAALQICCEWWVFELVILMAGSLANAETAVAVMGITFQLTVIGYMLPSAVGGACNTIIANELGAGHAETARLVFKVGLSVVICIQVLFGLSIVVLRDAIPRAFTGAADVVELTAVALPVVGSCVMSDGINALLGGVLRGCGRQAWGAALNLIGYWCVGFPMAILLGFKLHLAVWGFWAALALASAVQACVQLIFIARLSWQQEVERAAAVTASHERWEPSRQDDVFEDPAPPNHLVPSLRSAGSQEVPCHFARMGSLEGRRYARTGSLEGRRYQRLDSGSGTSALPPSAFASDMMSAFTSALRRPTDAARPTEVTRSVSGRSADGGIGTNGLHAALLRQRVSQAFSESELAMSSSIDGTGIHHAGSNGQANGVQGNGGVTQESSHPHH